MHKYTFLPSSSKGLNKDRPKKKAKPAKAKGSMKKRPSSEGKMALVKRELIGPAQGIRLGKDIMARLNNVYDMVKDFYDNVE